MQINDLLKKLDDKTPFSLSRRWDWEWLSVFGCDINHYAADWTLYYPEIWEELNKIIDSEPNYYMWMQQLAMDYMWDKIKERIKDKNINRIEADILHCQSQIGNIQMFTDALAKNDVIFVWPERLKDVKKLVNYKEYLEIPLKTAFLERDRIENELRVLLNDRDHTVVLFAAASLSNYLIDRLYKDYWDKHTFIDIGSLFEPYVWLSTRQYHNIVLERLNWWQ